MEQAVSLLEDVLQGDLERCSAALRADDRVLAQSELERAFAKLDMLLDLIRTETGRAVID